MKLEKQLINLIKTASKRPEATDLTAKVLRTEGKTAWVHFDGGAEETPVEMSVSCEPGDEVRVRLNKGAAYLIGNNTDPPTGMRVINTVKNTVKMAYVNIEELAKNVHDQFVLIGTSSINKLSNVMSHSSEGTNIYDDLSTVGNAYAHIDSDGLKIKRVANKDEIDDEEDSEFIRFASNYIQMGYPHTGYSAVARGEYSVALGTNNDALGRESFASGFASQAKGNYSQAMGYGCIAEGESSIALGYGCHTRGDRSFAEGYACYTGKDISYPGYSANSAHAEGNGSIANGQYSHAEGSSTASGNGSHSQNLGTQAVGMGSHAGGLNTVAGYDYQTVIGKHNNNRSDTLFEVGNGGWSGGTDVRSNAFDVTSDGYLRTGQGDEKIAFGKVSGAYGWYAPPATQGGSATFYPWIILNNGKIPDTYLPSYVDDVIEGYYKEADGKFYEDSAYTTEITGERGKIYVSLDTNTCYRWSGTVFVAITSGGVVYSAGTGIDIDANNEISVDGTVVALLADLADVATSGAYSDLSGTPNLATVATSGDYDDLTNKPSIPAAQVNADWNATSGVAEILNKPSIPAAQVNSDWNASSGVAQILNKPTLATVATSGDYDDLTNKPSIPAAQVNADWNATSGVAKILNKPTIPAAQVNSDWNATSGLAKILNKPTLATVATSGSYNDLNNKPTIPSVGNGTLTIQKNGTNVKTFTANQSSNVTANITVPTKTSDLTNDSGFITGGPYLPLSGGTMTGPIITPADDSVVLRPAQDNYDKIGSPDYKFWHGYFTHLHCEDIEIDDDLSINGDISCDDLRTSGEVSFNSGGITIDTDNDLGGNGVDTSPRSGSDKIVTSGGVYSADMHATTASISSGSWTADSYTSPSGTVYAYKYAVPITGLTAASFVDLSITSGSYTGAYCVESDSTAGYAVIRTATLPSAALSFRIYYKL